MDRIDLPAWMAMPLRLATFALAIIGTLGIFLAATRGEYGPAVWGFLAFAASGALWYVADAASTDSA